MHVISCDTHLIASQVRQLTDQVLKVASKGHTRECGKCIRHKSSSRIGVGRCFCRFQFGGGLGVWVFVQKDEGVRQTHKGLT